MASIARRRKDVTAEPDGVSRQYGSTGINAPEAKKQKLEIAALTEAIR
jgi:hypothetical protein